MNNGAEGLLDILGYLSNYNDLITVEGKKRGVYSS
jgi:hypothetical protein